ncbi:MAG: type VI secretion system contractile sheath small subunit [Planctomycetota bacterium]
MADDGSVAPRERVNIMYKPATGGASQEKELPLKLLMMGDYTLREDSTALEDRKPINIDKNNFNDVMKSMDLKLDVNVANKLAEKEGEEMPVSLKFESLKDFGPEAIATQVPELKKLLDLRQALSALKGPMGNIPDFRKKLQELLGNEEAANKLLEEIGGGGGDAAAGS